MALTLEDLALAMESEGAGGASSVDYRGEGTYGDAVYGEDWQRMLQEMFPSAHAHRMNRQEDIARDKRNFMLAVAGMATAGALSGVGGGAGAAGTAGTGGYSGLAAGAAEGAVTGGAAGLGGGGLAAGMGATGVAGAAGLAPNAVAPLSVAAPGASAASIAPIAGGTAATGGVASIAGTVGTGGMFAGMSTAEIAKMALAAGSTAYSAYANSEQQKDAANFARDESRRRNAMEMERIDRIRMGPLAKLAPFLMQDALRIYGLGPTNLDIGNLQHMMGVQDLSGMQPFTGFGQPSNPPAPGGPQGGGKLRANTMPQGAQDAN